jgi:hypothetical protein
VSALAHYLEEAGIPAVAIALIRPQAERTRPPRALWVPFELGRPLGPPNDPAFQTRVLLAALGLLTAPPERGPVLLADFPDDDPSEAADPAWVPPVIHAADTGGDMPAALADALEAEMARLAPAYAAACGARMRTTVGLSGLAPAAAGAYVAAWLRGARPSDSPVSETSPVLLLRFALDDVKAFYLEAALAGRGNPSSRQQADWLYQQTAAGAAFFALRRAMLASADEREKTTAAFVIPGVRVPPGG